MVSPTLAEVIALSAAATPGPWEIGLGGKREPVTNVYCNDSLGSVVATCAHRFTVNISPDEEIANAAFIAALVNWFRASAASLRDEDARDAELFRYMEKHAAGWFSNAADHPLPRIVIKPYFTTKDGGTGSLIVTNRDGVGTCTLRTALRMMQDAATQPAAQERHP